MAEFTHVGAVCSVCAQQIYLPYRCGACSQMFCQEHVKPEVHKCAAAANASVAKQVVLCPHCNAAVPATLTGNPLEGHTCAASQPSAKRCAAKGCREQLFSHNTVHCWQCRQDVCIRHRFEDDHPCIPLATVVTNALQRARGDMGASGYNDAHDTLTKVFGNILKDPANEKFRTLKKDNKIVKEKLNHPACIHALKASGFQDAGQVYSCPIGNDLAVMRKMHAALLANPPGAAASAPVASAGSGERACASSAGGGTRLVDGVIIRDPRPAPAAPPPASAPAVATQTPAMAREAPKPRTPASASAFQRRDDPAAAQKAQDSALQEARRLQKERYKAGYTPGSAAPPAAPQQQQQSQQQPGNDCVLQ